MRYESTLQAVSNIGDDHDGDGGTKMIMCSGLEKKEKNKMLKAKV